MLLQPLIMAMNAPSGSGKSEVGKALRQKFGNKNDELLQLDEIIEDNFEENMLRALNKDFVVGEMYFGDGHTQEPDSWISRFRERNYVILSVILRVSFDICTRRAICRTEFPLSPINAINMFNSFYQNLQNVFAFKAKVKEICVDNENKTPTEVAQEIMESLSLYT
jgi:thymidylate kinase